MNYSHLSVELSVFLGPMASPPPWEVIHKQGIPVSSSALSTPPNNAPAQAPSSPSAATHPVESSPCWEIQKSSASPSSAISRPVAPPWKVNHRSNQSSSCVPTTALPSPQGSLPAAAPPDTVAAAPRRPWKTPRRPTAHVQHVVEKIA